MAPSRAYRAFGSHEYEPDTPLHRDIRSTSVPKKRRRQEQQKYYGYRAVHPSWIGQKYWTVKLVSQQVIKPATHIENKKLPNSALPVSYVLEKEEDSLFEDLMNNHHEWFWFRDWCISEQITLAVAQAQAADLSLYPRVILDPTTSTTTSALSEKQHPITLDLSEETHLNKLSRYPIPLPTTTMIPNNKTLALKLRLQTWTKQDNFTHKSHFINGPDVRHHRGKRRHREKHLEKENLKTLRRSQKDSAQMLRNVDNGWGRYRQDTWLQFQGHLYDPEDRDDECDSVVYDDWMAWWWDDQFGLYEDQGDETGGYQVGDGQVGTEQDYWDYTSYFGVIDRVRLWREGLDWDGTPLDLDGEGEVEVEIEEEDLVSELGSDIVVLQHDFEDWSDEDSDFDMLADVGRLDADATADQDWNMLVDEWSPP